TDAEKLVQKAAIINALRADYQKQKSAFKLLDYDGWFAQPLNNAHLAGIAQYQSRRDAFRALFEAQGGDFEKFFAAVEALGKLPQAERDQRLDQLEADRGKAAHRLPGQRTGG
ncbi:MAG TPA: aminopeptidase, partial [bacterium]